MLISSILLPFLGLATTAAAVNAFSSPQMLCPLQPATPACQERIFGNFMHTWMEEKDYEGAWRRHVDVNYIQHNPYVLSGRDNAIKALAEIVPSSNFTLLHRGFSGDRGWAHYVWATANSSLPSVVIDVFRFNGTCIVEHWDVIQSIPANAPNELAMW